MEFYRFVFTAPVSRRYTFDTACFNVEIHPVDCQSYKSEVEVVDFASFSVALVDSRASIVQRKQDAVAQPNARRFTLLHVLEGQAEISHHLGMTTLQAGQFSLFDNSQARSMFVYHRLHMLQVCVHEDTLRRYLPEPEEIALAALQSPLPSEEIFKPMLLMWDHFKQGNMLNFDEALLDNLLQDVSARFATHKLPYACSHHNLRRIVRIKEYIEQHLNDPQLTVTSLAQHFKISPRYLRSLFQSGEKLSHYILRRRLEESARLLLLPANRTASITDIAFRCGFNSTAHFARSFKKLYGETARDFRQRHLLKIRGEPPVEADPADPLLAVHADDEVHASVHVDQRCQRCGSALIEQVSKPQADVYCEACS